LATTTIHGMIINGFFECIRVSKSVKYGMHVAPIALHNSNNRKIIKNLKRVKRREGTACHPMIFFSNACTFTMVMADAKQKFTFFMTLSLCYGKSKSKW
jgi:hypothetical protein